MPKKRICAFFSQYSLSGRQSATAILQNAAQAAGAEFKEVDSFDTSSSVQADCICFFGDMWNLSRSGANSIAKAAENGAHIFIMAPKFAINPDTPNTAKTLLGLAIDPEYAPKTELRARIHTKSAFTSRIAEHIAVYTDAAVFPQHENSAGQIHLTLSWQFSQRPLWYTQNLNRGSISILGLGESALQNTDIRRLIYRFLTQNLGFQPIETINFALIGYGAIGFEHAEALLNTENAKLSAVCDRNPARLDEARRQCPDIQTVTDYMEIAQDPSIDAVIIGSPPNLHAPMAADFLQAGKHVVVEKPFCITTEQADTLIELAKKKNKMLTVYQSRRWDPDFLAIKNIIQSGKIGGVFHIETFIGSFSHPCEYWHSHQPISGGVFYDWGSHYIDWILQLIPDTVTDVRAHEHKRVWLDVTNADQASITIRFAGGQEATFIHSDIAALLKPKWYILGESGAITANWRFESVTSRKWTGDLIEEHLSPSESLPILTAAVYDSVAGIRTETVPLTSPQKGQFHKNIVDHLIWKEPLDVTPQEARRNIAIMEAATVSAASNGALIQPN